MEFRGTYAVKMTRTEYVDAVVTDATEREVWDLLRQGLLFTDTTQEEYDSLSDEGKADFLAEIALSAGLDCAEITGEHLSVVERYRVG